MPSYRVAFVNPYITAAEVQAFSSLRLAAETMGIILEHRKPKELSEDDPYDFLIPVAFTPKTTSHPSLLSAHSPRTVYVDSEEMFAAIASHDGYLTISENLKSFFSHLSSAYGKALTEVGDYYNCPQKTDIATNIPALRVSGDLGLCYFGINWDMRAEPLFRLLSHQPYMRIYGPADSWRTVRPDAYKGQLPFDGASVQQEYARFGVGLVCLGYEHLMDDIISNRVFEISSVGAVSISPDTPWMCRHFGESVYYYDPFASVEAIVAQIDAAFGAIRSDPREAQRRAGEARAIFEARFHAGAMLEGAVTHFERWKAASTVAPDLAAKEIDVLVIGADAQALGATVASLRRQRAGRFRVIHAVGGAAALAPGGAVASLEAAKAEDDFASTLLAALGRLRSPYVAVVRAGDKFLSHHFERLLSALAGPGAPTLAYSDALGPDPADPADLAIVRQGAAFGSIDAVLDRLVPACILAERGLFASIDPRRWGLGEAGTLRSLTTHVLAVAELRHMPGPTCILSPVSASEPSLEDRLANAIELAPLGEALRQRFGTPPASPLAPIAAAVTDLIEAKLDNIAPERVFEGGMIGRDVADRTDLVHVEIPLTAHRLAAITPWTREGGAVRFRPAKPFDIALRVDIGDYIMPGCRPSVVFGLESAEDTLFLGLVDAAGEIVARTITPKSRKPLKVWVNSPLGDPPLEAIIQAWKRAPTEAVGLVSLTLAYRVAEVAAASGRPDLTREEALAMLLERARTESVGQAAEGATLQAMDLHHPRSAFRHFVGEEDVAEEDVGADPGRVFRTGDVGWDYFGQMFIPGVESARALKLELDRIQEPCSAFLTNTDFDRVMSPVFKLRAGKAATTVWLPLPEQAEDLYLVLQAMEHPDDSEVVLRRLSMAVGAGAATA